MLWEENGSSSKKWGWMRGFFAMRLNLSDLGVIFWRKRREEDRKTTLELARLLISLLMNYSLHLGINLC